MHRAVWGGLFALLLGGAIGFAWLQAGSGPARVESRSVATSAVRDAPASDAGLTAGLPGGRDGGQEASGAFPTPPPANASASGPGNGAPGSPEDAELERVAEALAREPALIDAMQDAASHPDATVRAEAEALVADALERARARGLDAARSAVVTKP